jgi:uncharacterized protein YktA (UPF0223 family)
MFLKRYIQTAKQKVSFMPSIMTMGAFVSRFASYPEGINRELLFTLYDSYRAVLIAKGRESQLKDFDRFIFWGEMLLDDFNDVDSSLVDASQLFKNLRNFKNIQSNYLDEDQKQLVRTLWGESPLTSAPIDAFWLRASNDSDPESMQSKFISLWEILPELYTEFNRRLKDMHISTQGLQMRTANEYLKHTNAEEFPYRKVIFVGFSEPTAAELAIFQRLKDWHIADFFWDNASPMVDLSQIKGGYAVATSMQRRMARYAKAFPHPEGFILDKIERKPDIEVVSIPSNVAQSKLVNNFLNEWAQLGEVNTSNPSNTAIVLPDESLLLPVLMALPADITEVNITMGVPYMTTTFAAMLRSVVSMQLRARKIHGSFHYYYEDLLQVMSNPYFNLILSDTCDKIKSDIDKSKAFNVEAKSLVETYPDLAYLFTPVKDLKDVSEVHKYTISLISNLKKTLEAVKESGIETGGLLEIDMLSYFEEDLAGLEDMIKRHDVQMSENTYFHLFERLLAARQINLTGMPLRGLQIMGVLETRNLDFDNVIILSMNERIFPRKSYKKSMIPNNLRVGYLMPTQDDLEGAYAYYFARLISRAKHVKLVYDSRVSSGTNTGEMSRYITQLRYIYGKEAGNISFNTIDLAAAFEEGKTITVEKTPAIKAELEQFKPGGKLKLSASALKTYKKCKLQFYLQYVKNLRGDNDVNDYMTEADYGSIVHKVVELLYEPYKGKVIDEEILRKMSDEELIKHTTRKAMMITYYRKPVAEEDIDTVEINTEGEIISDIIVKFIKNMLTYESLTFGKDTYIFVDAEMGVKPKSWKITPDLEVNFKMSIDRVDQVNASTLRFIDYKTGSDEIKAGSVAGLFKAEHKTDAIFQLLTYCEAYGAMVDNTVDIVPYIYPFRQMVSNGGIVPCIVNKREVHSYKELSSEFLPLLQELICSIFDDDTPFSQTTKEEDCKFCPFTSLCGRYPKDF